MGYYMALNRHGCSGPRKEMRLMPETCKHSEPTPSSKWVPWILVTDNGIQFKSGRMEDLPTELDIHHRTASVFYPQANYEVEGDPLQPALRIRRPATGKDLRGDARVTYYDELANEQGMRLSLDLLEEKRTVLAVKMARKYYV
ncbi:hypothetical protein LIER_12312 [Lithospermum erythrorhizon]|uniref:Transposase n=1 Tax=Lithospermum erythrorhizon TaxID=34254 RepID=A0AAV3PSM0_LITER